MKERDSSGPSVRVSTLGALKGLTTFSPKPIWSLLRIRGPVENNSRREETLGDSLSLNRKGMSSSQVLSQFTRSYDIVAAALFCQSRGLEMP